MPPDYLGRFQLACNAYRRTLHVAHWQSFVEQIRKERAAANVMVRVASTFFNRSLLNTFTVWSFTSVSPWFLLSGSAQVDIDSQIFGRIPSHSRARRHCSIFHNRIDRTFPRLGSHGLQY